MRSSATAYLGDMRSSTVSPRGQDPALATKMIEDGSEESNRARLVLVGHLMLTSILIVLLGFRIAFPATGTEPIADQSLLLLLCTAWSLGSWVYVRRTLFDPYALFVLLAVLFHGGYSVLRLFNAEDAIYLLPDLSLAMLSTALLVVVVGLVSLHFGALVATIVRPQHVLRQVEADRQVPAVLFLGIVLTLVALPGTVLAVKDGVSAVGAGGYKALFIIEGGGGPIEVIRNLSADFFLTGAFFLMVAGRKHWLALAASILLVALFSGYNLYIGHRGYAILPLVAAVWLYHHAVRRLPLALVSGAGLVGALYALPIVRQVREVVGVRQFVSATPADFFASIPDAAVDLVAEAGGTLMTVGYTVDLVPSVRPFELGGTYMGALANAVPMVSWTWPYGFGSDWLAWTIKPEWAMNGFGFGYSFLAEAYLNFAWVGVIGICVLIGFGAVSLYRWAGNNGARLATLAVFLPALLFYVRGESVDLVRPLLWRALLPYAGLWMCMHFMTRDPDNTGGRTPGLASPSKTATNHE